MATTDKARSLDGLMEHLRDDCGIQISGSDAKEKLRQYGYYHGYKGYRFYKQNMNRIPYTDFSEMIAVMKYDNELKRLKVRDKLHSMLSNSYKNGNPMVEHFYN